jgi:ATP-dependent helicase HrpA
VYPGFVTRTPAQWLGHYPRYLNAVLTRLQRQAHAANRDSQRMQLFAPWWQRLLTLAPEPHADFAPPLSEYRWLLEEYRVSLFAQELKTAVPVSPQRLQHAWQSAAT